MNELPEGYIAVPASAWQELVQYELKCQELAAQVEALRKIFPLKVLIGCDGHLNYPVSQYNDVVEAFNATPQQHLLARDAKSGRKGFIAGCEFAKDRYFGFSDSEGGAEYHASVLGGKE